MTEVYTEKDFVEVVQVNDEGEQVPVPEFPNPVPKSWVGTDLLPDGVKAKSGRRGGQSKPGDDKAKAEADDKNGQQVS